MFRENICRKTRYGVKAMGAEKKEKSGEGYVLQHLGSYWMVGNECSLQ